MRYFVGRIALAILLAALLLVPAQKAGAQEAASDSTVRAITLDQALAMAQQNAVAVIEARGRRTTSEAAVRSAYAAFLPSVSLSAGASRQLPAGARTRIENGQVVTLPSQPWSSSIGLGANMTLFNGGGRFFDLRQAKAQASAAGVSAEAQTYSTALAVKQQFFDILAVRETEAAARAQLAQAEQNFRTATAKVRARVATRSDSLRSEIQLQNARLAVNEAVNALRSADASLTRAIGAPSPVTAATEGVEQPVLLSASEAELAEMASNGPLVREAQVNLAAARAARSGSWADYLPSLTASYSRSGSGTGENLASGLDDASYSGSFRLSASLPLFDQLNREARVTQAKVAQTNAEAALRDARLATHESLTQALGTFRTAGESAAAQTVSVQAAEEDLRVQQQRYAVGASTLLDVLISQTQLDQARRDLIRARYDQRIAKAQIEALVGRSL